MSLSEFFASLNQNGQLLAGLGAVFAALFAGIGSAVGVGHAGQAGAAVIAEDPDQFGSVLVLLVIVNLRQARQDSAARRQRAALTPKR